MNKPRMTREEVENLKKKIQKETNAKVARGETPDQQNAILGDSLGLDKNDPLIPIAEEWLQDGENN